MASKSRGGLSKPEYARKQAATAAKKNASIRSNVAKSVSPLVGAGPLLPGQSRVTSTSIPSGPLLPGQSYSGEYSGGGSKSSSKSTPKPTRASASNSKVIPGLSVSGLTGSDSGRTGTPIGTQQGSIRQGSSSLLDSLKNKLKGVAGETFGDLGQMFVNNGLSRASSNAFLSDSQRETNRDNAGLGVNEAIASDFPTGYGPGGEVYYNNFDPAVNGPTLLRSDFATPGTDFSRPGSEVAYNSGIDPRNYGREAQATQVAAGSSPTPVSRFSSGSPATQGRTPRAIVGGNFSSTPQASFQPSSPVQQDFSSMDFTPVDNGQSGTRRQFLGNGYLSNGMASNGKGAYGLDSGLSFGTNGNDGGAFTEDMLRNILGIQTAQAQETPQQMDFGMSTTPVSAFNQSFANGGLTLDPGYSMPSMAAPSFNQEQTNAVPLQRMTQTSNPGGSQGGGVAQQFSQGATGGNPLQDYYKGSLKGFSAQEKAQKKALNELLKSIKNQYSAQQTTGLDQLNKSKQEDLLKLSGLFSFANQSPDSEQRIQYEQRANQDYAGQQSDFLAKLAAAQGQAESDARRGYQGELANIAGQRNTAQENIAKLLFQAQQDALDRSSKSGGTSEKNDSLTYLGDDGNGNPVYWNNRTKQQFVGSGLTRKAADPFTAMFNSLGLGGTTVQ